MSTTDDVRTDDPVQAAKRLTEAMTAYVRERDQALARSVEDARSWAVGTLDWITDGCNPEGAQAVADGLSALASIGLLLDATLIAHEHAELLKEAVPTLWRCSGCGKRLAGVAALCERCGEAGAFEATS